MSETSVTRRSTHMSKLPAANAAVQTFGGYGMDAEYDVERNFRETRHLAEHVLSLPRSF